MAFKYVLVTLAVLATAVHAGVIGPITYSAPVVAKLANPAVDAVASTHQNVVRSFGGTVSQYSKAVDTPYSSVRKEDTRISNNVYTPAVAKTVAYAAAPVPTAVTAVYSTHHQAEHAPIYEHHEPAQAYVTHEHVHHEAAPATVYQHGSVAAAPAAAVYHHESVAAAPAAVYRHESVAAAPAASAVYTPGAVGKTVQYAAPEAAHVYQQNYHHHQAPVATTTYNHGPDASTYSHNAPGIAAYGTSQTVRYSPAEMVSHMSFDGFGTHWGF